MKVFFREWLFALERKLVVKFNQHSQYGPSAHKTMLLSTLNFFTFMYQLSIVSCCTTCDLWKLLIQSDFTRNFQMCRRLNDCQDFEFCPEAEFYTSVCLGDRILQLLNACQNGYRRLLLLDFLRNKFWRRILVCPCATIAKDVIEVKFVRTTVHRCISGTNNSGVILAVRWMLSVTLTRWHKFFIGYSSILHGVKVRITHKSSSSPLKGQNCLLHPLTFTHPLRHWRVTAFECLSEFDRTR